MKKQRGMITIEYILLALLLFSGWSMIRFIGKHFDEHRVEYIWSVSQYDR